LQVCYGIDDYYQNLINEKIWYAIERYVLHDFVEFKDYFSGWEGYSAVRFNRYDENTEMQYHCDHIKSMFLGERRGIPILSIVGVLNDDYEGGDFKLWQDTKINLPAGSIVIFPSNFLYPHEVTPVTKGVRYSYVSWVW
jgi:predicted 2-oxoglutarate/Fe(II)-dependent dioxygenase YbiX